MKRLIFIFLSVVFFLPVGFGQTTSYLMKYYPYNESPKVISKQFSDLPLAPASTLKLFVSWMSFNQGYATDECIRTILMKSDNDKADSIFILSGGTEVLKNYLIENQLQGITDKNFIIYDGSGLNKNNRTTCDLQVSLLEKIYSDKFYNIFKTLMAQPGKPGTMEKRLLNHQGKIYAKTGTLNGTIALAGFYELKNGVAIFSINSNNFKTTWDQERKRIDGILESLINQIPQDDSSKN
jgi:D-alanyl-D-alanine carboxypeptidase